MGEYPRKDFYGDTWLDSTGFIPIDPPRSGRCRFGGEFTNRYDIHFNAWYCGSEKCALEAMRVQWQQNYENAKRAAEQKQEATDYSLDTWESEGGNGTHNR